MRKQKWKRRMAALLSFLFGITAILPSVELQAAPRASTNVVQIDSSKLFTEETSTFYSTCTSNVTVESTNPDWEMYRVNVPEGTKEALNLKSDSELVVRYTEAGPGYTGNGNVELTVTYDKIGTFRDLNGVLIPVGVRMLITDVMCQSVDLNTSAVQWNGSDKYSNFEFYENFWDGFFQTNIQRNVTTYELFNANTGERVSAAGMYMTFNSLNCVSMDYMEMVGYKPADDSLAYEAYVTPDTNIVQNGDAFRGNSNDFEDKIGSDTFLRNSVSFKSADAIPSIAYVGWNGISFWHTLVVSPLTANRPEVPYKVGISDGSITSEFGEVKIGQDLTYDVCQRVQSIGVNGNAHYQSMYFQDTLPNEVTFKSARVVKYGIHEDGSVNYADKSTLNTSLYAVQNHGQTVTAEMTDVWLRDNNSYDGSVYALEVVATVNENALQSFSNTGKVGINDVECGVTPVKATPVQPTLAITKDAKNNPVNVLDTNTYTLKVSETTEGAIARNVVITDQLQPSGVVYDTDSFQVTGSDGKDITQDCNISIGNDGKSFIVTTGKNLSYGKKITVTYQVLYSAPELAGTQVDNLAKAKADNAPETSTDESVKVLKPILSITKESPKYELKVGDKAQYTVKVSQTVEGAIAHQLEVADISLPKGLKVDEAKSSGVKGAQLVKEGTGWKVTVDNLKYGESLTVIFDATATESVNAQETVNTATAKAMNADTVQDVEEVYVNTAELNLSKDVSKYEWRVGDTVDYTVKVTNTKKGSIANNTVISDITLPEGLKLMEDPQVSGVPETVNRPVKNDKNVHGETNAEPVKTAVSSKDNQWTVSISALPADAAATITFKCQVTDAANGNEVINTAHAKADNAAEVKDDALIWVNTPGLNIEKAADIQKVKVGDIVTYTVNVTNQTVGTLARNVVIEDQFDEDAAAYVKLQKNSIVLLDSEGNKIEDAKISVKNNSFRIETGRTLVNAEKNYGVWNLEKNKKLLDGGKLNPEGIETESTMTVEYQVKITGEDAAGEAIRNVAAASCDEGIKVEDNEEVLVNGPHLDVEKESDQKAYGVDGTAKYQITVRETREGYKAKDVVISDIFDKEGAVIAEDSIKMKLNGKTFEPKSITVNDAKNGYVIETGKTLTDEDKLIVTYDVTFRDDVVSDASRNQEFVNTVTVKGTNTNESTDDNTIMVSAKEAVLNIVKKSDQDSYYVGETGKYTLLISQPMKEVKAKQVVVTDTFDQEGMTIVSDSVVVKLNDTEIEPLSITLNEAKTGYVIETGVDLSDQDILQVVYDVRFDCAVENGKLKNTAIVKGTNTNESTDDNTVTVKEAVPVLQTEKVSDALSYQVGDTGNYTVKVTQTEEYATAKQIAVTDSFDKEGMTILDDSVHVTINDNEVTPKSITRNDAKNGYVIETGVDLSKGDVLLVTYSVVFEKAVEENKTTNTVAAKGTNTEESKAENTVTVIPANLDTKKTSDKTIYQEGEMGTYTVTVAQTEKNAAAKQVILTDQFDQEGMTIVDGSVKVYLNGKEAEPKSVLVNETKNGYTVETGIDLTEKDVLTLTYEVQFNTIPEDGKVTNVVIAKGSNTEESKAENTVSIVKSVAALSLEKTVDKQEAKKGDTVTYTLSVKETEKDCTAEQIVIEDELKHAGVKLKADSLKIVDQDKKDITKECKITADEHSFKVETGKNLAYDETLTVTYEAVLESVNPGDKVANIAAVSGENAERVTAETMVQVPETFAGKIANGVQTGLANHAPLYAGIGIVLLLLAGILIWHQKKQKDNRI